MRFVPVLSVWNYKDVPRSKNSRSWSMGFGKAIHSRRCWGYTGFGKTFIRWVEFVTWIRVMNYIIPYG